MCTVGGPAGNRHAVVARRVEVNRVGGERAAERTFPAVGPHARRIHGGGEIPRQIEVALNRGRNDRRHAIRPGVAQHRECGLVQVGRGEIGQPVAIHIRCGDDARPPAGEINHARQERGRRKTADGRHVAENGDGV